jgi:hypothetical protein
VSAATVGFRRRHACRYSYARSQCPVRVVKSVYSFNTDQPNRQRRRYQAAEPRPICQRVEKSPRRPFHLGVPSSTSTSKAKKNIFPRITQIDANDFLLIEFSRPFASFASFAGLWSLFHHSDFVILIIHIIRG